MPKFSQLSGIYFDLPVDAQLFISIGIGLCACALYGFAYSLFYSGSIKLGGLLFLGGAGLWLFDGFFSTGYLR